MVFWNVNLEPGKGMQLVPFHQLRLTSAALKEFNEDQRTTVQLLKPKRPLSEASVIAALTPDKAGSPAVFFKRSNDHSLYRIQVSSHRYLKTFLIVRPSPVSIVGWSEDLPAALQHASSVSSVPGIVNVYSLPDISESFSGAGDSRGSVKRVFEEVDDTAGPSQVKRVKATPTTSLGPSPEQAEGSGSGRPKRKGKQDPKETRGGK
ncbi:hypothetical protein VKT23_019160 [Stygiomarasmius scandens]|uniref:Nucleoplasmin-like domain-containing protein n=1 Tax=Marasmiellus scandens TaxID=2682957 RepID=A0ABR1IPE1_9AGAR